MNLQTELSQKQTISQQMLQSVRILQMGSQELDHYLEELCLENPVMELNAKDSSSEDGSYDHQYERQLHLQRSFDWLISTDRQNRAYYEDDSDNGTDYWQDSRDRGDTLNDHLHSQILTRNYTKTERIVMDFLIDSLDFRGYLTETVQSTAALFAVPESLAEQLIQELKSLDPPGVGAADLVECLLLQVDSLEQTGNLPPGVPAGRMRTIIRRHLEDIGRSHFHKVMRTMNLTHSEVAECCSLLRSLSPYPANSFATRDYIQYVTPDVYIVDIDGQLEVLMNDSIGNRLQTNSFYVNLKKDTKDLKLKQYLQDKIRQAENIKKDIGQRSSTICQVVHILADRQDAFFHQGPGSRRPLNLKDIASELNLHESTVSRAMQDKYLQCKWGIYPLNYFLNSAAVPSPTAKTGETREAIEQKIKEIISQENKKHPLSDQAIADLFTRAGTKISRRTINKYRSEMGIPDKSGRKQA